MGSLHIAEMPSPTWSLGATFGLKADRSGISVADYLKGCDVTWQPANPGSADVRLYKPATLGRGGVGCLKAILAFVRQRRPSVVLLGEPREVTPYDYFLASPRNTLAVAPGDTFGRLYFASEWTDPRLEDWHKREDRVCWIGRPLPARITLATRLEEAGIALDIFSRTPWPLASWRGYVEDEQATAARYKFRVVAENYATHAYHSEKLFNAIRSGNVAFYVSDPALKIPHLNGAYLPLDMALVRDRHSHAGSVLKGIERVMFTSAWEPYSFRAFYDRIIALAKEQAR